VIGNEVWIGQNVTIMPGVKVGDGASITTNSTVVKNIEPCTIYGGNPVKFIKKRFSDEKVEFLLKLQWWNWNWSSDYGTCKEHKSKHNCSRYTTTFLERLDKEIENNNLSNICI